MTLWADYSDGVPTGAQLSAAGITGVIRYVGVGGGPSLPGKRLSRSEYIDLTSAGIRVLAVVEWGTTDADGGYDAGVANATAGLADIDSITSGLSPIEVVFAANDKPGWVPADVDYVRGFRDVLGLERTGAYGFAGFLNAVHNAGHASVYWQAGNPPSVTGTAGIAHLWQRNGYDNAPSQAFTANAVLDLNDQLLPLPGKAILKEAAMSWNYLADEGTQVSTPFDPKTGFTRCAEVSGGVVTGCDWGDIRAKDKTYGGDGTGSVRGVSTVTFDDYVAKSTAITGVSARLDSLIAAVKGIALGGVDPAAVKAAAAAGTQAALSGVVGATTFAPKPGA